ncbi:hypothetical protein ACMFMG_011994 [Clarireedia jacksonii]
MAWQPDTERLLQLSIALKDSYTTHDKDVRINAERMLAEAKSLPDNSNYLTYLFSSSVQPTDIRCAAATMLKNHVKEMFENFSEKNQEYIRTSVLDNLRDNNQQIRKHTGNIIAQIVSDNRILVWPRILSTLLSIVGPESGNQELQETAMETFMKICDNSEYGDENILDKNSQEQRHINSLIPELIELLPKLVEVSKYPVPNIQCLALRSINLLIPHEPAVLLQNLEGFLNYLTELAQCSTPEVHKELCRIFVELVEISPDQIQHHISFLVDYIIIQQQNFEEKDLQREAAEFWLKVADSNSALQQSLEPDFHRIIPVLLSSMVYCEEDIARLEDDESDAEEEDRAEDTEKIFAQGRISSSENNSDENPENEWNVRRVSAHALIKFAGQFPGPIFQAILPVVTKYSEHSEWQYREAAVFALGSVAEECKDVVAPSLPVLIPNLIKLLEDSQSSVRNITCWALGRYSSLIDKEKNLVQAVTEGILRRMQDNNKRVQQAGASALACLGESVGDKLIPHSASIIEQLVFCFNDYKGENMMMLYDSVGTIANTVWGMFTEENFDELIRIFAGLISALNKRWKSVSNQSFELIYLFECLSSVVMALEIMMAQDHQFQTFVDDMFSRCIMIIYRILDPTMISDMDMDMDICNPECLVPAISLLIALFDVLDDQKITSLVCKSKPDFFELLTFCIKSAPDDGCRAAYELLGHCAKRVFPELRPFLQNIMQILVEQLKQNCLIGKDDIDMINAVNNACWSAGVICIQLGEGIPNAEELFQSLLNIIRDSNTNKSVNENAIIALGRLGLQNPQIIGNDVYEIAEKFLERITSIENVDEKASALTGIILAVQQNPSAMRDQLSTFYSTIAQYKLENDEDKTLEFWFRRVT